MEISFEEGHSIYVEDINSTGHQTSTPSKETLIHDTEHDMDISCVIEVYSANDPMLNVNEMSTYNR